MDTIEIEIDVQNLDMTIGLDEWQNMFMEWIHLDEEQKDHSFIYTDDPSPSSHEPLQESSVIMNLSRLEKSFGVRLNADTRKYVSDILYTELRRNLAKDTAKKAKENLFFRVTPKILYPLTK